MLIESIKSKKMVVKIGSSKITEGGDPLNREFMSDIARQVAEIKNARGTDILIVSSGVVACGMKKLGEIGGLERLGVADSLSDLVVKQRAAAYGQPILMQEWMRAFSRHGIDVAQMLYMEHPAQPMNTHNTLDVLESVLKIGGVPIINANDAVSNAEMRKLQINADNDYLAFTMAHLVNADTLVLLTDKAGVLDETDQAIPYARRADDVIGFINGGGQGSGGMLSKVLCASEFVLRAPFRAALVAGGRREDVLVDAAKWKTGIGTWFVAHRYWQKDENYRRWHA